MGVNSADEIWTWKSNQWESVEKRLRYVSVGRDGHAWGVDAVDQIYRWDGDTWKQLPGRLKQLSYTTLMVSDEEEGTIPVPFRTLVKPVRKAAQSVAIK